MCLKHLEKLLNHSRFAQFLSEEYNCGVIWYAIYPIQHNKPLKVCLSFTRIFKVFIADFK
jgi:hypothetical protein